MTGMEAKNVVVIGYGLKGPGEGFFDIAAGMCSHGVAGMGRYLGGELIPQMREDPEKRAFFVIDVSSDQGTRTLVDKKDGAFWKEDLRGGKERKECSYPFEVRKLELGEDGVLCCTDPYAKEFNYLAERWPQEGLAVL